MRTPTVLLLAIAAAAAACGAAPDLDERAAEASADAPARPTIAPATAPTLAPESPPSPTDRPRRERPRVGPHGPETGGAPPPPDVAAYCAYAASEAERLERAADELQRVLLAPGAAEGADFGDLVSAMQSERAAASELRRIAQRCADAQGAGAGSAGSSTGSAAQSG